jgi:hypothetical protein
MKKALGMLPYLVGFIPKEMNFGEALILNVVQGIGFVPTVRENIKRDLPSDRKGQPIISKILLKNVDEFFSNPSFLSITVGYHQHSGLVHGNSNTPSRIFQNQFSPESWGIV